MKKCDRARRETPLQKARRLLSGFPGPPCEGKLHGVYRCCWCVWWEEVKTFLSKTPQGGKR